MKRDGVATSTLACTCIRQVLSSNLIRNIGAFQSFAANGGIGLLLSSTYRRYHTAHSETSPAARYTRCPAIIHLVSISVLNEAATKREQNVRICRDVCFFRSTTSLLAFLAVPQLRGQSPGSTLDTVSLAQVSPACSHSIIYHPGLVQQAQSHPARN
jgi:hypothetical protein